MKKLLVIFLVALISGCYERPECLENGDCGGDGDADSDSDTDSDTDSDSDTDTDADTDSDSDGDSDSDSDCDCHTDADADGDCDADSDADTDTDTDSDGDADTDSDTDADAGCEGEGNVCFIGQGNCIAHGTLKCGVDGIYCDAVSGEPEEEICDGIDNDCDGEIDEDCGGDGDADSDADTDSDSDGDGDGNLDCYAEIIYQEGVYKCDKYDINLLLVTIFPSVEDVGQVSETSDNICSIFCYDEDGTNIYPADGCGEGDSICMFPFISDNYSGPIIYGCCKAGLYVY
ncbi:MAG: hypothetical protein WC430_02585 [Patescibacteria group bacterium]